MRVLLLALFSIAAFAQQSYRISIGTEAPEKLFGTIWLYSYSWYGLQQLKLATIDKGLAVLPLDVQTLKRGLDPNPTTDAYIFVIQLGEHLWFRTLNISPEVIWSEYLQRFNLLGQTTTLPSGQINLVLPPPSKRKITFLYPDGRPAKGAQLSISEYLYDTNHCGAHSGLPLGDFRTDENGSVAVVAPLVPLYLDGVQYLEEQGVGPAGVAYSYNSGLKLGADETIVLKKAWEFTPDDYAGDEFKIYLLGKGGRPRTKIDVFLNWRTNGCGGADRAGVTDKSGMVTLQFIPQTVSALTLSSDEEMRSLTDRELRTLFSRHKLVLRW